MSKPTLSYVKKCMACDCLIKNSKTKRHRTLILCEQCIINPNLDIHYQMEKRFNTIISQLSAVFGYCVFETDVLPKLQSLGTCLENMTEDELEAITIQYISILDKSCNIQEHCVSYQQNSEENAKVSECSQITK